MAFVVVVVVVVAVFVFFSDTKPRLLHLPLYAGFNSV
jgi:hypothetical protein